ncbi:hypothetical protein AAZX31_17G114000 [Glycine max]|nr:uncharacterized protein LOC100776471 isoform X1 [Glycine max]XP_006600756.1 uncharacterized protein LOC100776471 isoform X1 [Glycine max]XP_028209468.1 uncharacterized protein LOC114392504 isoform X1 [Glycine soja]XP_028209469.1 uncharacterized protein LOC114392504 isoform X1 [Glycine soja]KAG4378872.1 hypothetical protein GLYMA_17G117400v4 [Glycine max]KAG4932949.1 hypothetical protein JHK87_046951 [Glycine soja]KAG5097400.1 hypothetical protein JHK82_047254 [Glycine max]KAH1117034.1 hyp|eukprot:XP_003549774.1 uncharacterized protein LOC100776471 isoform X1 [Glycine max]
MNLRPLGPLVRMAAVIFGGVATLNLASAATIKVLRFASEKKREKVALPCWVCRGKGFYICKLCNGNATISWSPMFDPIAVNPCVCPTCEGNRVQRCLNCLGKGYD